MSLVLDDVVVPDRLEATVTFAAGLTVVVGENGAGKSTLLDVAAGTLRPPRGTVRLGERIVTSLSPRDRARAIASLGQRPTDGALSGLRGWDRLAHGLVPRRGPNAPLTDTVRAQLAPVVEALELAPLVDRPLGALSGGERQRIHVGRALADDDAEVLILDEPFAGVDHRRALRAIALLRARAAAGTIVIVTVHDLSLAHALGGRLLGLAGGRVVLDGPMGTTLPEAGALFGADVRVVVDGPWVGLLRRIAD